MINYSLCRSSLRFEKLRFFTKIVLYFILKPFKLTSNLIQVFSKILNITIKCLRWLHHPWSRRGKKLIATKRHLRLFQSLVFWNSDGFHTCTHLILLWRLESNQFTLQTTPSCLGHDERIWCQLSLNHFLDLYSF